MQCTVRMARFSWWVELQLSRDVSKCAGMRPGELSVTRDGRRLKPESCAGSWGTQDKVSCTDKCASTSKCIPHQINWYIALYVAWPKLTSKRESNNHW